MTKTYAGKKRCKKFENNFKDKVCIVEIHIIPFFCKNMEPGQCVNCVYLDFSPVNSFLRKCSVFT